MGPSRQPFCAMGVPTRNDTTRTQSKRPPLRKGISSIHASHDRRDFTASLIHLLRAARDCGSVRNQSRSPSQSPARRTTGSMWPGAKNAIKANEIMMPRIGTSGTHGVRNGRCRSGRRLRSISTPAHTMTNASNVPMLTSSPRIPIGTTDAKTATNSPNSDR